MTPGFRRSLKTPLHRPLRLDGRLTGGNPPTLDKGKGVTLSRNGVGDYTLTLSSPAGALQSVRLTAVHATLPRLCKVISQTASAVRVLLMDIAGAGTDDGGVNYEISVTESANQQ